jgi:hypothetical protein
MRPKALNGATRPLTTTTISNNNPSPPPHTHDTKSVARPPVRRMGGGGGGGGHDGHFHVSAPHLTAATGMTTLAWVWILWRCYEDGAVVLVRV